MIHLGEFLKTSSLRSNSVTRQVSFNRSQLLENVKIVNFNCDILGDFQTLCDYCDKKGSVQAYRNDIRYNENLRGMIKHFDKYAFW